MHFSEGFNSFYKTLLESSNELPIYFTSMCLSWKQGSQDIQE